VVAAAARPVAAPAAIGRLTADAGHDARQREVDDARAVIIRWVDGCGLKIEAAIEQLNVHAAERRLESSLAWAYAHCHDKKRAGQRLAKKTYYNWLTLRKTRGNLAPAKKGEDLSLPEWAGLLLQHYRLPQKPTLKQAMAAALQIETHAPEILYRGRNQGAALKAMLPFTRRGTAHLYSNDIWTGDGHGMKAKVAHPDHGRPFTPEVTMIVDVASRKVLGWSVSFAENMIAVCDALRHAVVNHRKPLIYYSDNGAGQTGKMLDAPIGGMLARLGIDHQTGIPGNPQGRGLVERLWQTLTIPLAKQLPTFRGHGADGDHLRKSTIQIEKDLRAGRTPKGLPTLREFVAALDAAIADYNGNHVHSELGTTPDLAYAAKLREDDSSMVDEHEKLHLFRPHVERTAARGEVSLWNNIYFSADLMEVDKQKVLVGYDIHDAGYVVVRRLNGEYICRADWNANSRDYFPQSKTDDLRHQRVERRLKKLDGERDLALAELGGNGGNIIEQAPLATDSAVISGFAPIKVPMPEQEAPVDTLAFMTEVIAATRPKQDTPLDPMDMQPGEELPFYLQRLKAHYQPTNPPTDPNNEAAAR